jgi:hypothetical protein
MVARARLRYARGDENQSAEEMGNHGQVREEWPAVAVIIEVLEQGEAITHLNVLLHFGGAYARQLGD